MQRRKKLQITAKCYCISCNRDNSYDVLILIALTPIIISRHAATLKLAPGHVALLQIIYRSAVDSLAL